MLLDTRAKNRENRTYLISWEVRTLRIIEVVQTMRYHLNSSTCFVANCPLVILAILGCDSAANGVSRSSHPLETEPSLPIFDAGVVLSDRAGYLCVPLERFGLKRPDDVFSVTSTCDCIRPQLVEYVSEENLNAWAVFLEFKREESSKDFSDSNRVPAKMGVAIGLNLSGGRSHSLTLRLLLASLTKESAR